jgi:hypothetical protein
MVSMTRDSTRSRLLSGVFTQSEFSLKKRPRGPIFWNFPLILEAIHMPALFFRPPVIQLIDFTHLNLFVAMGLFQKSEPFFDLRHLIDNFCHLFRAE